MSHRKDENLDFNFLNPVLDSASYVYYSPESSFNHSYTEEASQPAYSPYSGNYQNPFHSAKTNQYSPIPRNIFTSESFDSGTKGYTRTFSGNDLLAENTAVAGKCLRRFNSDIPSYCEFGTYNPFQGSPLEISNLGLLESRPAEEQCQQNTEPVYETELVHDEPAEAVQNKRTYKDVLTFPTRSESPINSPETLLKKTKPESDTRKETYKDKLLSPKLEPSPITAKATPSGKPSLNNHRSQVNTNPKRPLKINNNLSTGSITKGNSKSQTEKNWHSVNESVRSVRSQTDLGGIRKKNRPSIIDSPSFEFPPSDDESVSPIEIKSKDLKKIERTKSKTKEKESEKSIRRQSKKSSPPSTSATLARAYFPKV